MVFHNLQLHLAYRYIKICVLINNTFCESLVKLNFHKFGDNRIGITILRGDKKFREKLFCPYGIHVALILTKRVVYIYLYLYLYK